MKITTIRISFNKLIRDDEGRLEETWKSMNYVFILIAYSFIGAIGSGLWTKNTALWARDWGQKKGAVRLRFKEEALREFGHPKSYPLNSLLVNVSPSKGPSYCSLNLILRLN